MAVSYISRYQEVAASDRYISVPKGRPSAQFRTYVAASWETFDHLAHKLYGDSRLYWMIADFNPHVSLPDVIPPGTELRLPL